MPGVKGQKMHPNSLKNLDPEKTFKGDNDLARMAQKKSVEARHRNTERRKKLQAQAEEIKEILTNIETDTKLSALDVLRVSMLKAINEDDYDTAADLAAKIAPYEAPKLQAIEQTNKEITTDELSDEELDKRLRELIKQEGNSAGDGGDS